MSPNTRRALGRAIAPLIGSLRHLAGRTSAEPRTRATCLEPLESRVLLSRVEGIDVSQWQGTIDWNQVRDAGKEFAFVRATIGGSADASNLDTKLTSNMTNGVAAGMLLSVYHHAKPDSSTNDAVSEANHFLSNAGQYIAGGYIRPVLVIEEGSGLGKTALSQWVNDFSDTVTAAKSVQPIIYTNTNYATNFLDSSVIDHDLWLARPISPAGSVDPQTGHPQTPSGFPNPYGAWNVPFGSTTPSHDAWSFWQYSWEGVVSGITENVVDLDVFQGDRATLESQFLIQPPGGFQLNINFGPYEADAPSGYINVANQLFGPILGYEMGWLTADAVPVKRTAGSAPDNRYSTYVRPGYQGVNRTFEVSVPDGTYRVRAVAGSPDEYGSTTKFWVEGTNVINGVTDSIDPFLSGVATVTVTDGRLTISSDAATAPNSRLAFVDIIDASRTSAPPAAPSNVSATPASSTAIDVRWTDNADNDGRDPGTFENSTWGQVNEGYKVERRDWNGSSWSSWSTRGHARADAELYQDTGLSTISQYQYRVTAVNAVGSSVATEGTSITTPANNDQQSYSATGSPWKVPALIQAEDFDRGGEGISYHDTSTGSAGGFYRDGGMDVGRIGVWGPGTPLLPRSHRVGWFRPGEWVEYTVDAPITGDYTLEFRISAPGSGAKFHASTIQGGVETNLAASAPGGTWDVPNTGDWDHFQTVEQTVRLPAGVQVIRVYADQAVSGNPGVMDFDWMRFTAGVDLSVSGVADADEETVGRHIALNDDHDELNTNPAGQPLPDNEADAIEGHRIDPNDADIVSAALHLGGNDGTWWLEFPSDIRVWRSDGSGGYQQILNGEDVAITPGAQVMDLKIEGIGASFDAGGIELRAVVAPIDSPVVYDTVRLTVASTDLDADSDDNDDYGMPAFSHEEDRTESDSKQEGKTLFTGDTQRVPISLLAQLPPSEIANAKIRLTYDAADLSGVGGPLRLWRSATSQDPADYVAPGEYTGSQLGLGATAQELILYMEGVALTTDAASRLIRAEIDPDGIGTQGFVLEDHVYVTVTDGSTRPAAIEGYVWDDRNSDGIRNSTTTFVPGDPPDVVYVIDISGSTLNPYRGTPVGDINGDGRYNTILDGEIAGFLNLNQYLHQDLGFGSTARVAVVVFSSDAKVLDLDPRSATALNWTAPATDLDGNLTPDVEQIVSGLKVGHEGILGRTDYEAALQSSSAVLEAMGAFGSGSTVVFLSDGYPNEPTDSPSHYQDEVTVLDSAGVNLRAFGAGTGASLYHLKRIDSNAEIFTTADPLAQQVFGQDTQQITVFTEPGLGGWTVFADLDANGQLGKGEPQDISDADGSYQITGLQPGSYTIRQVLQDDWQQTAPTGGTYAVTVAAGQVVGGNHFGNRHVADADLDVDSDNTNGTSAPDRNSNEDAIEGDAARLGKVVQINNGDSDADGIPGYADLQSSGTSFTPIVLDLSGLSTLSPYATVRFTYSGSPFYSADPASGRLRIWKKDAGDSRTSADYIRPGVTYYASSLGITSTTPIVTLYIESVVPTVSDVDRLIRVDVDPDGFYGATDLGMHDLVYVTAVNQPGMTDFTDSDGDALPDAWESAHGLDPTTPNPADADDDSDGLDDFGEFESGTNPIDTDTDDDLLSDGWEANDGRFDPLNPDQDSNGVIDGLDDPDGDALTNDGEENHGTDPFYFDSDDDLLPDGWEVQYGFDPLNPDENDNGAIDSEDDNDSDGLNNLGEANHGTDPTNVDTDGDGVSDLDEANQGSDPTDASDGGQAPPDDMKSKFRLTVGDNSGSHSERWALKVGQRQHTAPDFGKVGFGDYFFDAGKSYDVRLIHLGSKLSSPDYDWTAAISPTLGEPPLPYFIVDEIPKILGTYGPSTTNTVAGKVSHFHIPLLDADVDSNNDGGFTPPVDNKDEDRLERDSSVGKRVWASVGDADNDGIVDYEDLDGIDGFGFVPIVLRLSQNVQQAQPSEIQLTFGYDTSVLRLWKPGKDAPTSRSIGADLIHSGASILASALGLAPGGEVTIFVEALQAGASALPIAVTAQVTGALWSGLLQDQLHVKPASVKSVEFYKSETGTAAQWQDDSFKLPWQNVFFREMPVKLKVALNDAITKVEDLGQEVRIRSFSDRNAAAEWKTIPLNNDDVLSADGKEIRVTMSAAEVKTLGLLKADAADTVDEFTSADFIDSDFTGSNWNDGDGFDATAPGERRGKARGDAPSPDQDNGDLSANPPVSAVRYDFLKAAGVVYVEAVAGDKVSQIRQLQDQADTMYVSGHGNHRTGTVLGGEMDPSAVKPYWNQDLDTVIIAGCSVLDINDYNNFFTAERGYNEADHNASPGEIWATTGPKLLFGYNAAAPLDHNVGDPNYTKEIITKFLQSNEPDPVKRWMYANRDVALAHGEAPDNLDFTKPSGRPWNACAIDMRGGGVYWYWDSINKDPQTGQPTLKSVAKADW